MAVELMLGYRNDRFSARSMEDNAVQEAASGLESVEKLLRLLSHQQQQKGQIPSSSSSLDQKMDMDCRAVADVAVNKFKKVISLLGRTRTGHARFRRAPVVPSSAPSMPFTVISAAPQDNRIKVVSDDSRVYCPTPIQQIHPPPVLSRAEIKTHVVGSQARNCNDSMSSAGKTISFAYSPAMSQATSFMSSMITGDTDNSCKQQMSSQVSSGGKPPLSSSSCKRKCSSSDHAGSGKCSGGSSGRCHCSKRRKLRLKRVVRVPAISMKLSDIPPDDYSWRKYGQKPIKGSPHPRGYYKCSSVRGCPARKHVERALDDSTVLIVTYEGDHNHSLTLAESTGLILESS